MLMNALVVIVVAGFVLESILDYLNDANSDAPLDPAIKDLYDQSERQRSIAYAHERYRVSFFSATLSSVVMVVALTQGWFGSVDSWSRGLTSNSILISLIFVGALSIISWLLGLPFSIYSTFVIEERYGFNKTTPLTFIQDTIKGAVVSLVIATPLLAAVVWFYQRFGSGFWIYAWALVALFSVFMFMFGTSVILPLFNKLTPLEDGDLKKAILKYCDSQGYKVGRLFVMDGSRRSTKANAFFSGMGKSKMIVLFDTLIEKLTVEEVVAVLAHEIGHYKLKHTKQMFIASTIQTAAIFALLGWSLQFDSFAQALGAENSSFHISALVFFILLTPANILLGLLNNSLSRKNEFGADAFSKKTYKVAPMKSALRKISSASLSNLTPHPAYVAFNYTHPPLASRLRALD